MKIFKLFIVSILLVIMGCDPGQPSGTIGYQASGYAAPLTDAEFNQLSPEQQYAVASKLLGTMFRGISAEDFFDLSDGVSELKPVSATFISDLRKQLSTDLSVAAVYAYDTVIDGLDAEGNPVAADARYIFNNQRPRQLPLARIKEYPLSRDLLVHWMAHILSNTIMFSPALEMESTEIVDVQNMYRFLVLGLKERMSIREIIRANLSSLARWRVSRSPENHALEAYELYLGLFETEEDSFRGGIACKDLYLTSDAEDYLIRRTDFPNTVPQLILDSYYVTVCDDLYDAVAGHPLIIPRATEALLNYFFSGRPLEERLQMIGSITNSNPETYEDIFTAILFSKEYLLNTERPKSFEENLFPVLDVLKWTPEMGSSPLDRNIFFRAASDSASRIYLGSMGWDAMSLKIGRLPDVPLDSLSFANYHKAIREELLIDTNNYKGRNGIAGLIYDENGDPNLRQEISLLSVEDYMDLLFLNAIQRKATEVEKTDLIAIFNFRNYMTTTAPIVIKPANYDDVASVTLDYISRLAEFYYFKAIN